MELQKLRTLVIAGAGLMLSLIHILLLPVYQLGQVRFCCLKCSAGIRIFR